MDNSRRTPGWGFVVQWVAVCSAGFGLIVGGINTTYNSLYFVLRSMSPPHEMEYAFISLFFIVPIFVAPVAMLQWLVLSRFLPQMRILPWVLWSCLFFVLWFQLKWCIVPEQTFYMMFSLVGAGQWIALRKHLSKVLWWIPVNGIAFDLNVYFFGLLYPVVGLKVLGMILFSAIFGLITGLTMLWLLRTNSIEITEPGVVEEGEVGKVEDVETVG